MYGFGAAIILGTLALQAPAGSAQPEPVVDPAEAVEATPEAAPPRAPAPAALDEAAALRALREMEEQLSVGQPLTPKQIVLLRQLAKSGASPRVRALATAILPWLRADEVLEALLAATADEAPLVRAQATEGLNAAARRLEVEGRGRVTARAIELLDDPSGSVACAAGNLLARLAPEQASSEMSRRKESAPGEAWACWRRVVPLPARAEAIPPPPPEPPRARTGGGRIPPGPTAPAPRPETPAALTGGPLLLVTGSAVGFGIGGSMMNLLLPSRDTLTYRRQRTVRRREEPALGSGLAAGLVGAAAVGAGVWALDQWKPLTFEGATAATFGAAAGTVGSFGASLATSANGPLSATFTMAGAAVGLGVGVAVGMGDPSLGDLGFASAAAGHGVLLGTLITFAATPVGFQRVFEVVPRNDFGFGVGLLTGGVLGLGALALSPVVELSPARLMIATGIGFAAGGLGLGVGYLAVPVDVDVRQRIAAGIGAGTLLLGTTIAWFLIPDAWTEGTPTSAQGSALVLERGRLRVGVPMPVVTPEGAHVRLLGGTF